MTRQLSEIDDKCADLPTRAHRLEDNVFAFKRR
jgi:hypothetical protein